MADRAASARGLIDDYLIHTIENREYYDYDEIINTHPTNRNRIRALLEKLLGNDIFQKNGSWVEKIDGSGKRIHFQPHDFEQSGKIIQKIVREQGYMRMKPRAGERITEDGRAIANWDELEKKIEAKAEELMRQLDPLVKDGDFTLEKKNEWLALMDKEVAEFKKQNPIEIAKPRLGGWVNRIELKRLDESLRYK